MMKTVKRMTALVLALVLVLGQLAIPTSAEEDAESQTEPQNLELATPTGGTTTEDVAVEVTVTTDDNGGVFASMTTQEGGYVTESGLTVQVQGTSESDADGNLNAQMSYEGISEDGHYMVEGGTEETVEVQEEVDVTVDVIVPAEDETSAEGETTTTTDADGNPVTITVTTADDGTKVTTTVTTCADGTTKTEVVYGESKSETKPTNEGDNLKSEDPANYDQTTVTTTGCGVEVIITGVQVESGDILFTDEDGNALYRDEEGNPVYVDPVTGDYVDANGEKVDYIHDNGENWQWIDFQKPANDDGWDWGWGYYTKATYYVVDAEGNETCLWNGSDDGLALRYVQNMETGEIVGGLYCVDVHTGNMNGVDYRLVDLEDAAMEGYYTEEEASHLRFVMENGYYTNVPDDSDEAKKNLEDMKKRLHAARIAGQLNLTEEQINALTFGQAVAATGMAVWQYGNRNTLEDVDPSQGETFLIKNTAGDETVQKVYEYLISGTSAPAEKKVISEESFVEKMEMVVGTMVKSDDASHVNNDDNHDNDVYNVSLKFSLVVTPDTKSDDLIVKVMDGHGNVVKEARIAGDAKENENLEYLTPDENGAYTLTGMHLAENTDAEFNLKLEGTQYLEEGVYVFTADKKLKDAVQETYNQFTTDDQWSGEQDWAFKKLKNAGLLPEGVNEVGDLTKEQYKNAIPYLYGYGGDENKNPDGTWNENAIVSASQNLIGKFDTVAQVDVGMQVNMTFNVDEATLTTVREWRHEGDPAPISGDDGGGDNGGGENGGGTGGGGFRMRFIPAGGGEETVVIEEEAVPLAADPAIQVRPTRKGQLTTILDEEVPLADAPETGDPTLIWGAMGLLSLAGSTLLGKKKKEEV